MSERRVESMERPRWYRSPQGVIAGVCRGLAEAFDLPVGLVRLLFVLSIIFLGTGLGIYILLALSLPRQDKLDQAMSPKILGVCSRLSYKFGFDVGLVRFLMLFFAFSSFGFTIIVYIILHFMMD